MHNLGTVFSFEFIRTIKKKSFWIMAMLFPVIIGVIFAIQYFSNMATLEASEETASQKFSIEITDQSGLINEQIISALGASKSFDKQASINKVVSNQLDAYFFYPDNLDKNSVEVYAKDVGIFNNSRYQSVATTILQQSVSPTVSPQATAVLKNSVSYNSVTYRDGKQSNNYTELIAPGLFLIIFYLLISMFGNQMLTSTTEEKENRVTEMILTTIEAKTLIIGKILSLIALAFVQVLAIVSPILIGYLLFRDQLSLPNFDISSIPLDPVRIGLAAVIFALSFLLYTGLLVAIGAIAPTAKEAGSFFGVIMIFLYGPLYAVTLFISTPESPIVKFLSFFPLTAPIPLLLRNAVGNLSTADALIGCLILLISAGLAMIVAVKLFRYGVLQYSSRLSLSVLLKESKKFKANK